MDRAEVTEGIERPRRERGIQPPAAQTPRLRITPASLPARSAASEAEHRCREERERAAKAGMERLRREALVVRAQFPKRHLAVVSGSAPTWPDGCADVAWDAVSRWESVVLLSDRGRGKTLVACWLGVRAARELGIDVRYWRAADLLADIRHRCYNAGQNEAEVVRSLAKLGLLIVDEFHERTGKGEYEFPMMSRILEHRYASMLPTVIVTNHRDDAAFEAAVGASVMSRLRRVAKACLDYGQRVQNSVFECKVDPAQFATLKHRLLEIIDPGADSVRFYTLGKDWLKDRRVEHHGAKPAVDLDGPLIV